MVINYDDVDNLKLNAADAASTINVNSTNDTTPTIIQAGTGANTVNVGNLSLDGVAGTVTVLKKTGGTVALTIDDRLGNPQTTYNNTKFTFGADHEFGLFTVNLPGRNVGSIWYVVDTVRVRQAIPLAPPLPAGTVIVQAAPHYLPVDTGGPGRRST